ncbi:MAG: hypothetical protein AAGC74_06510 [Verrucomicrobiota bacterium]
MGFKRAGRITYQEPTTPKHLQNFLHSRLAFILMGFAVAIPLVAPALAETSQFFENVTHLQAIAICIGAILWLWGSIHVAVHLNLHPAWGLLGLFFIFGLILLIWTGTHRTRQIPQQTHYERRSASSSLPIQPRTPAAINRRRR